MARRQLGGLGTGVGAGADAHGCHHDKHKDHDAVLVLIMVAATHCRSSGEGCPRRLRRTAVASEPVGITKFCQASWMVLSSTGLASGVEAVPAGQRERLHTCKYSGWLQPP